MRITNGGAYAINNITQWPDDPGCTHDILSTKQFTEIGKGFLGLRLYHIEYACEFRMRTPRAYEFDLYHIAANFDSILDCEHCKIPLKSVFSSFFILISTYL